MPNTKVSSGLDSVIRIATFALVLFSTQPMAAQSVAPDSARLDSVRAALLGFPLGSPIRVLTVGNNVIEGRLAARSDTGVVVRHRSDSLRASIVRIASVWRPAANIKSGAITGGLVGAVVIGLLSGTVASGLCDAADCHGAYANGVTVGAVLGLGIGAAVGMGVGALTQHWERVWP